MVTRYLRKEFREQNQKFPKERINRREIFSGKKVTFFHTHKENNK